MEATLLTNGNRPQETQKAVALHVITETANQRCRDAKGVTKYSLMSHEEISKIWLLFLHLPIHYLFVLKIQVITHHKVNGQYFIFSIFDLNEDICPWLSLWRFHVMFSSSLFITGSGLVNLLSLILPIYFKSNFKKNL